MHEKIKELVADAIKVVVIQADNPDGDSLGSALALEQILGDMGKEPFLYCGVDIPDYLKHFSGWDRVSKEIPAHLDMSIIVDTSALVLLEKLETSRQRPWIAAKPVVVLDHHSGVACDIPYATVVLNDFTAVATGEVIYKLSQDNHWPLNLVAKTHIASSILADSMGLTAAGTSGGTYRIMADLVESGVDRPAMEEARRAYTKMPETIFRFKAKLIEKTELYADNKLAVATVSHEEIMEYSPLYNPAPLIQNDMLQIEGIGVAIVLKQYNDGKVTGSIRCNQDSGIAADLAVKFGGGGHIYAAGFKVTDGRPYNEIKSECIHIATDLLNNLSKDRPA